MKLTKALLLTGCLFAAAQAMAAQPVRIGVTTVLSGPNADRGQSQQYGIELALQQINEAGGVLGRPVEAFYVDHADNPDKGVAAVKRLIGQEHVSALIGALATPVTRAIMPVANAAKVPLVIDISAGHEFVDAAGVGGYDYVFKTSPSEIDIAAAMMRWLKGKRIASVAIVSDDSPYNRANAAAMEQAASAAGIKVLSSDTIAHGTSDLAPLLQKLDAAHPDRVVTILGASNGLFFKAYEQSAHLPLAGRIDFAAAKGNLSPQFLASGGLDQAAGIAVFTPLAAPPAARTFVTAYESKYGLVPTQRSFLAYEAARLVVDAIRRAHSDSPASVERALKSTRMPSLLGGTLAMDAHNHAHAELQIAGWRNGGAVLLEQVKG